MEIDGLVYAAYGLNRADIAEVETWYARRYETLAAAQRQNLRRAGKIPAIDGWNVYCDETGHLPCDRAPEMILGAMLVPQDRVARSRKNCGSALPSSAGRAARKAIGRN